MKFPATLVVGYGNMAGAMVSGWLGAGVPAARFTVYHPHGKQVPEGVGLVSEFPERPVEAVLLGVKPAVLDAVAPGLAGAVGAGTLLVSVLAGVELASLRQRFPQAGAIVRLMPNLACALGKSPNALVADRIDAEQRTVVTGMAELLGSAEWLEREDLFDLVTALAGSGPGFVYRFIDALGLAAARLGLPTEQAQRLAVQMVEGAAALAAASTESPAELARRVASPGGMTQRGLDVLDRDDALVELMVETLRAARDRGAEMAREARQQG